MRTATLAVASLLFISTAHAAGKDAVYSASKSKVFAAALEVVATEFRLESADKETGLIASRSGMSMRSWGQDLSLVVVEVDADHSKVIVNSKQRGQEGFDWGEGGKLQKKVLRLLGEKLAKDAAKDAAKDETKVKATPAPEAPKAAPPAMTPAEEPSTPGTEVPAPAPDAPPTTVPEAPTPVP